MSMRGNSIARVARHGAARTDSRPPLQGFMARALRTPHRALFGTPFYSEGWALYWEMALWDLGFPRRPRTASACCGGACTAARGSSSRSTSTSASGRREQCIDFLVDRVGHERFTATGEVRRSFNGNYSPLYQAAYMLGGLQLRALAKEVVPAKLAASKAFADAVLWEGRMPIEILRAVLGGRPLTRDYRAQWAFYGDVPAAK